MQNKYISSLQNQKIKNLRKWLKKPGDFFVVEGYNMVYEALKIDGLVCEIYEVETKNLIKENKFIISEHILENISIVKSSEGVLALCKKQENKKIGSKIIFLDDVQDPGNVGTIIRSAVGFGFDTLFTNVNVYNPKILRSTQGSIFKINIVNYQNSSDELKKLQEKKYQIIATSLDKDSMNIKDLCVQNDYITVVLGNEGHGIKHENYKYCSTKIYIPIQFESLNVAVSAGIILYKINELWGK